MMEVLEQAIEATRSLDQKKLAEYMHANEFVTVVGAVRFAKNGEWAKGRVMAVQYGGIKSNDLSEFQKPGVNTILWPPEYKTGDLKAPFK
jgi:branched-chain amino acid transport system substrate-binding protein